MSLPREFYPKTDNWAMVESQRFSLPELYASIENFNKAKKKSSLLKTHDISLKEAQQMLTKNLSTMTLISRTGARREDPRSVFPSTIANKEEEKLESMAKLLHHSLVTGSLSPMNQLAQSQKRLAQSGIPPPKHTFPYNIVEDLAKTLSASATRKKSSRGSKLSIFSFLDTAPKKLAAEDKAPTYCLVNPEKQFIDLRDLEWRYFKGIARWKHRTALLGVDIKYDTEKRFVESQNMPEFISPPLVQKSSVIYPQVDFQKNGNLSLKWHINQ